MSLRTAVFNYMYPRFGLSVQQVAGKTLFLDVSVMN